MDLILHAVDSVGALILAQMKWVLPLAAVFTALSLLTRQACNPGRPWWRSRDILTDTHYCFLLPVFTPYLQSALALMVASLVWSVFGHPDATGDLRHGVGPLSELPFWWQVAIYVIGSDFLLYWAHRMFHDMHLWPFHAVHHSAEDVDWTTSWRAHPVDSLFRGGLVWAVMLASGISPEIMVGLIPFDIVSAAFVHGNLNWTLGPLKYVLATPVFHRWHHSAPEEGGEKNFSPTFAIWDVLFGTFYMPEGKLPQEYGVDDPDFPKDFFGQMIVPFRHFLRNMRQQRPKQAPTAESAKTV